MDRRLSQSSFRPQETSVGCSVEHKLKADSLGHLVRNKLGKILRKHVNKWNNVKNFVDKRVVHLDVIWRDCTNWLKPFTRCGCSVQDMYKQGLQISSIPGLSVYPALRFIYEVVQRQLCVSPFINRQSHTFYRFRAEKSVWLHSIYSEILQ